MNDNIMFEQCNIYTNRSFSSPGSGPLCSQGDIIQYNRKVSADFRESSEFE